MTELAHRRLIHLPATLLYPMTQMGIQKDSPAVGLNFIRFPLIVSTGKLKGITGFRFRYTSEEALASYALNIDEKSDFPSL
jgi:hypothetical protein